MDHSTFTAKIKIHSCLMSAQFGCVALLDTGSPQLFITRNAWEHMVRSGVATTICETQTPPRSWGGFGESPPLQTSTAVRLSVQFLHNDQPTVSLAVWTYIVPSEAMQHAVLLGHDSWMRFSDRSYHTLPPRPSDTCLLGNLTLSHQHSSGAVAFASDCSAPTGGYHLFTKAIEASRSHVTTNSFQFPGCAVTALQLWPAAILWICFMTPLIFQSTRASSKTVYNRSHLLAQRS